MPGPAAELHRRRPTGEPSSPFTVDWLSTVGRVALLFQTAVLAVDLIGDAMAGIDSTSGFLTVPRDVRVAAFLVELAAAAASAMALAVLSDRRRAVGAIVIAAEYVLIPDPALFRSMSIPRGFALATA